jgi:LPS export ABC transporter protein LptC
MAQAKLGSADSRWHRSVCYLLFCLCGIMAASCVNDIEKVNFFNRQHLPAQEVKDANIIRSVSGELQVSVKAPVIDIYQKPENKTVYPKGVQLYFYNADRTKKAYMRADYGISYDDQNLMMARDNVVIIDYRTGDTSYLDDLIWNSNERRIYSNNPVRSVNGQRVTLGDGFVSDENFENPQVLHQRGTVVINE